MSAGEYVYKNIKSIVNYCHNVNHNELDNLLDINYSKRTFDINFPFFIDINDIDETNNKKQSKRFNAKIYLINNRRVRVTTQWFIDKLPLFKEYLENKNIEPIGLENIEKRENVENVIKNTSRRKNSRYRGNAIGNASNLLIRNILSNIGNESFNEDDWKETKEYFENKCAYCNSTDQLLMEHAIPINKEKLGEHRLGNIILSCKKCNEEKANKDYKEFLGKNDITIKKIENYMLSKNYFPIGNNENIKKILNMAYDEVSYIADKYIEIINILQKME